MPYPNPKALADAVDKNEWDVALLGAEPERADKIAFTDAYAGIPITYLVHCGVDMDKVEDTHFQSSYQSIPVNTCRQADRDDVTIITVKGCAFTLWQERNIRNATLV